MRKITTATLLLVVLLMGCSSEDASTLAVQVVDPTSTPYATYTPEPTATPIPEPTPTVVPTSTPTPTPIPIIGSNIPALVEEHMILLKEYSPYIISQNILVRQNGRLDVQAGTQVLLDESVSIYVQGELRVLGEKDNPVVLSSSQITDPNTGVGETKYWGKIELKETSRGTRYDEEGNYLSGSVIKGAIISYGGLKTQGDSNISGGVEISPKSNLLIVDSKIEHSLGHGVNASGSVGTYDKLTLDAPILRVQNSYILNNGFFGIIVNANDAYKNRGKRNLVTISDSDIAGNKQGGIMVMEIGLDSKRNFISGNGEGIVFRSGSYGGHPLNIESNLIIDNKKSGVDAITWRNSMHLSNNSFINNNVRLTYDNDNSENGVHIRVAFNEFSEISVSGAYGFGVLGIYQNGSQKDEPTVQIESNIFERNATSEDRIEGSTPIVVVTWEGNEASNFSNNDFISNTTEYLFKNNAPLNGDVNAKNNWWGTDDEDAIKGQIYDYFQNPEYSIVDYSNWKTESIATKSGKVGVAANEVGPK